MIRLHDNRSVAPVLAGVMLLGTSTAFAQDGGSIVERTIDPYSFQPENVAVRVDAETVIADGRRVLHARAQRCQVAGHVERRAAEEDAVGQAVEQGLAHAKDAWLRRRGRHEDGIYGGGGSREHREGTILQPMVEIVEIEIAVNASLQL